MKSYLGFYQSSRDDQPTEATVLVFEKTVHIGYRDKQGQTITQKWDIIDVDASYSLASKSSIVKNKNESAPGIAIQGNDAALHIQALQEEHHKPWHKKEKAREWGRNLLLFLGIVSALVALYFLIVPWLSEKLASKVSVKTEEQFGEAVYSALGLEGQTDTAASFELNHFFSTMEVRTAYAIRITVIKGDVLNAFALPGGRIIIYDALLKKLETYPELAALLAHEFTHVNNKHSTKSIFRRLGSKIFIGVLFGNFGTVTSVLVDHADNLKTLKYSRRLEKEADLEGLDILIEKKIDPKGFAALFQHLQESGSSSSPPELLGSHPDISKRIEYIREKAGNPAVEEHIQLKTIFETIKQKIQ